MVKWKKIEGFNNRYSVSTNGEVRNDERNSIVKPMLSTSGYHYVHLVIDRKKYTKYVHRLVGDAFLENPNGYPQIDHINGCKTNNHVSNLRWVSVRENYHAYGCETRGKNRRVPVAARHLSGQILTFASRQDAAAHFNCSDTQIAYNRLYVKSSKKGWTFYKVVS